MSDKPFSQACENNKHVILEQLQRWLVNSRSVLEIGSGTGQHAVHFAKGLPEIRWQTSDQQQYHDGINLWLKESNLDNLIPPIVFKLGEDNWPNETYDAVFTANTAHIMQKNEVQLLMKQVTLNLPTDGIFCQYGPFIIDGQFSSQSNADFHQKLLDGGYGGYREISELTDWAKGLELIEQLDMPANNLLLVWRKTISH